MRPYKVNKECIIIGDISVSLVRKILGKSQQVRFGEFD
jgi:hypothetical protein